MDSIRVCTASDVDETAPVPVFDSQRVPRMRQAGEYGIPGRGEWRLQVSQGYAGEYKKIGGNLYYSKMILIGKIIKPNGWDEAVRMKSASNGNKTTSFMLSVKSKSGDSEQDDWFYTVCFGRVAESCKTFLKEGSEVLVEGRLHKRHVGPEGDERDRWEMIAEMVKFGDNVWATGGGAKGGEKNGNVFRGGERSQDW